MVKFFNEAIKMPDLEIKINPFYDEAYCKKDYINLN